MKEHNEFEGTWEMVETLVENGTGLDLEFIKVESEKIITFLSESDTVTTNGSLCHPGLISETTEFGDSGIFLQDRLKITPINCMFPSSFIKIEMQEPYLIVSYLCDDSCLEKYVRM